MIPTDIEFHPVNSNTDSHGKINRVRGSSEHRATCHRCGNMRKSVFTCPICPYIFCKQCHYKMEEEFGVDVFVKGCPVVSKYCYIN
jgi:hypothetical protein